MASLPYPLSKILNAGCKLEINGEVPLGETLKVRARIEDITEKSNKAFIHQIVTTSTRDQKNILVAHMYTVVILGKSSSKKTSKKLQVPEDARNLDQFRLKSNSGLKFALLTGDFNPVHWVKPVAMLSGFKSTILHGFASMARSFEVINNQLLGGNHRQLKSIEVKFTKPILLPGNVSFYLKKDEFFLAKNNDEKPNLVGSFELRSTNE